MVIKLGDQARPDDVESSDHRLGSAVSLLFVSEISFEGPILGVFEVISVGPEGNDGAGRVGLFDHHEFI